MSTTERTPRPFSWADQPPSTYTPRPFIWPDARPATFTTRHDFNPNDELICATVKGLPGPWAVLDRTGDTCDVSSLGGWGFRLETTHVDNIEPFYEVGPICANCPRKDNACRLSGAGGLQFPEK